MVQKHSPIKAPRLEYTEEKREEKGREEKRTAAFLKVTFRPVTAVQSNTSANVEAPYTQPRLCGNTLSVIFSYP